MLLGQCNQNMNNFCLHRYTSFSVKISMLYQTFYFTRRRKKNKKRNAKTEIIKLLELRKCLNATQAVIVYYEQFGIVPSVEKNARITGQDVVLTRFVIML